MERTLRAVLLSAVALVVVLLGLQDGRREVRASPSDTPPGPSVSAASPVIARYDGASKPAKLAPVAEPARAIDPCVLAQYAKLDAEVSTLVALHGSGTSKFADAYKQRKEQLVGATALSVAGCKNPGGK